MKVLLSTLLFLFGLQAIAGKPPVCEERINQLAKKSVSSNAKNSEYIQETEDAAKILKLEVDEFERRLAINGYTKEEFFTQVEEFKNHEKIKFLDLIFSAKALKELVVKSFSVKTYKNAIRGRLVTNTSFVKAFSILALGNYGSLIATHLGKNGVDMEFDEIVSLSVEFVALLLTDVVATAATAKHAAYLVAHPEPIDQNLKHFQKLSTKEKSLFVKVRKSLRRSLANTAKNSSLLGKISIVSGALVYGLHAYKTTDDLAEMLAVALVNTAFHVAYITAWTGFRKEVLFGEVIPTLNLNARGVTRKVINQSLPDLTKSLDPSGKIFNGKVLNFMDRHSDKISDGAEFLAIGAFLAINMVVASTTYVYGREAVNDLYKELQDQYFEEHERSESESN